MPSCEFSSDTIWNLLAMNGKSEPYGLILLDSHRPRFDNVDSYMKHRDRQDTGPQSLNQAKEFLAKRDAHNNEYNSNRAFKLLKQDEEIGRVNEKWWANLKQLENR